MKRTGIMGMILSVMALVQGCAPGYNSVIFTTRSVLGFNADTTPPDLELSISRYEGTLMPTFEGGQTLPVISSFSSDSNSLVNFLWGTRSTFATGEAAYLMSSLYADPTLKKEEKGPEYPAVKLSAIPDPKLPFGLKVHYVGPGEVRPVVCGTDTTLGIKVSWSGTTGQYPSAVSIGFKRKEAAWTPVGIANLPPDPSKPDEKIKADVASILATLDVFVSGPTARSTYLQYFATGSAANQLARHFEVRKAMLKRTDAAQDIAAAAREAQAEKAKGEETQRALNRELITDVMGIFNNPTTSDENKKNILAKAQNLKLVGQNVTKDNFQTELKSLAGDPSKTASLKDLKDYAGTLK